MIVVVFFLCVSVQGLGKKFTQDTMAHSNPRRCRQFPHPEAALNSFLSACQSVFCLSVSRSVSLPAFLMQLSAAYRAIRCQDAVSLCAQFECQQALL